MKIYIISLKIYKFKKSDNGDEIKYGRYTEDKRKNKYNKEGADLVEQNLNDPKIKKIKFIKKNISTIIIY